MEDAAHQRTLAGAGDTGHAHQPLQRHAHVDPPQVVQAGLGDIEPVVRLGRAAILSDQRMPDGIRQAAASGGVRVGLQLRHRALGHHAPAVDAGARPQVDDVLGAADGVFVVLHHQDGVALAFQPAEGVQQHAVVARVQADGGFVQDVAHALEVGAQLGRDADALGFAARKRGRGAVQVQVGQPHLLQEVQTGADFRHDVLGDFRITPGERQGLEAVRGLLHGERRVLGDVAFPEVDRQRLRLEPAPGAGPADPGLMIVVILQPDGFLPGLLLVEPAQ